MSTTVGSIVTPSHILADAKELMTSAISPARQRTVISRAYYAAYHAAGIKVGMAYQYSKDQPGGVHQQFIRALRQSSDPLTRKVGDRLRGLYGRRILADYQLGGLVTRQTAQDAIEDAEEIVYDYLGFEAVAAAAGE